MVTKELYNDEKNLQCEETCVSEQTQQKEPNGVT